MSYGQYSPMGGHRRTIADMLEVLEGQGFYRVAAINRPRDLSQGKTIAEHRKGKPGNNRLVFKTMDGATHFLLHETIIASLSPDRSQLTLNDGGWATITTRRAWDDAARAFGLPGLSVWGARPKADHSVRGVLFDRTATFQLPDMVPIGGQAFRDVPMIRAIAGDDPRHSPTVMVEYRDGQIISSAGVQVKASPLLVMVSLHHVRAVAKRGRSRITFRGMGEYCLYDTREEVLGYDCYAGCLGRSFFVGCHQFNTSDARAALRRIEAEHPDKAKVARKVWTRRNKRRLAQLKAEAEAETKRKAERAAAVETARQLTTLSQALGA
jgi:hypothetical protein